MKIEVKEIKKGDPYRGLYSMSQFELIQIIKDNDQVIEDLRRMR